MTPTLTAQPIGHTTPAEWLWVVGVVSLLVAVSGWLVATGAPSRRPWPFSWLERASSSLQRAPPADVARSRRRIGFRMEPAS